MTNSFEEDAKNEVIDMQPQKDLDEFKNYYESASDEEKKSLDEKYNQYFNEELQKDSELKNALADSEENDKSVEITSDDIDNLNTVRTLTDVLNNYPDISGPEYKAIKRLVDEYTKKLNDETKELLSNKEKVEGDKDNHD